MFSISKCVSTFDFLVTFAFFRYLEEACLNLEVLNPITKEHVPTVLKDLNKHLTLFINNNPSHKFYKDVRMLHLATQSLIKSIDECVQH